MTLSRARIDVAPVVTQRRNTDSEKARLQAEYALQVELFALPWPKHEQQATTGQGETDYVNVDMERHVVALLDAHTQQAMDDIAAALARIEDGTYGDCVRCAMPIDADRLSALPRVKFCIDCQRACELA